MSITVEVVGRFALDDVESAARALHADAELLQRLGAGLPSLDPNWAGAAAVAATARIGELRRSTQSLADFVLGCAQVLSAAAIGLRPPRDALQRAAARAADAGLQVTAEGALARAALHVAAEVDADAAASFRRCIDCLRPCRSVVPLPLWQPPGSSLRPLWQQLASPLWAPAAARPSTPSGDAIWLPSLIPTRAAPLDVAAWWSVLPPEAQARLLQESAHLLGNLDGMPAHIRHLANVSTLDRELATGSSRRAMLLAVRRELATDPGAQLLTLDLSDGGLAAVALGDADRATDVAIVVPGLNQDVTGDLHRVVRDARNLRDTAAALQRLADRPGAVTTVAWIGYRTPNFAVVPSGHRAKAGGRRLASFASGLDASREIQRIQSSDEPALHLSLVGHSYGTVAVGYAMRRRPAVDEVVLLGSPGVAAETARQLTGRADNVFVGEARGDPVADLNWFGPDPSLRSFGARALQTDGGRDPLTGSELTASYGHSNYFKAGSESVRNIAAVTIGTQGLAKYGDMSGTGDRVLDGWRLAAG